MKKLTLTLTVALSCVAAAAGAQELQVAASNRSASLSGEALERTARGAAVRRGARGMNEARTAISNIERSGALKTQIGGRSYEWSAESHPSLARVVLKRVLAAGQTPPSNEETIAELRGTQSLVDEKAVLARAESLMAKLKAELRFSRDETFVPVHQGGGALGLEDHTTGRREVLVTERRVVYRRHVQGVPVLGRAGELEIVFDTRGEAKQIEVPTDDYSASSTLTAVRGREALQSAMRAVGFADAPTAVDEHVVKDGRRVLVKDLQCGLFDDEALGAMRRGCMVRYADEQASIEEFLPVQ